MKLFNVITAALFALIMVGNANADLVDCDSYVTQSNQICLDYDDLDFTTTSDPSPPSMLDVLITDNSGVDDTWLFHFNIAGDSDGAFIALAFDLAIDATWKAALQDAGRWSIYDHSVPELVSFYQEDDTNQSTLYSNANFGGLPVGSLTDGTFDSLIALDKQDDLFDILVEFDVTGLEAELADIAVFGLRMQRTPYAEPGDGEGSFKGISTGFGGEINKTVPEPMPLILFSLLFGACGVLAMRRQ